MTDVQILTIVANISGLLCGGIAGAAFGKPGFSNKVLGVFSVIVSVAGAVLVGVAE